MIDHLFGRPNPSWKRIQVFLVIFFWLWRITRGKAGPPRIMWLKKVNRSLQRYTPWQIIVSTLTTLYAVRNLDKILGLGSPEPLARLYSSSYYRATWINAGLEAGFATAMSIRPKGLRDICSILFSIYYILYANEADEKLRRYRAVPTVEMLRTTWEKTTNPYIRMAIPLPFVSLRRRILLPRPNSSKYTRPISGYLFFYPHETQLRHMIDLILDFPGGGFVAMSPEHHEERLRMWAVTTGRPVLSIDYGKAPEYPYPFAIDEAFDVYRVLVESTGMSIGMSGEKLNIIVAGDSAGATLAVNVIFKILELNQTSHGTFKLPLPVSLVLNYAALDFNFTSWMSPANLKVLQSEQSSGNLLGLNELAAQKDHLQHVSPLSMVRDSRFSSPGSRHLKRKASWKDTFRGLTSNSQKGTGSSLTMHSAYKSTIHQLDNTDGGGELADTERGEDDEEELDHQREEDRPIRARVRYSYSHTPAPQVVDPNDSRLEGKQKGLSADMQADCKPVVHKHHKPPSTEKGKEPIGTRLTMTSRTGFFQDRIVSPSMMRAMAILYIGPHRNPDFATDYHISPILAPAHLLAQFPPLLMQCGEKDPFVDDTVIFCGRIREAKRARRHDLELAISGKSARFGESLRMSTTEGSVEGKGILAMKNERDKLANETEDDWVQMVLFSDWSHGYLQMPTLMSEAKAVIENLAEWMDNAFAKNSKRPASHDSTYPLSSALSNTISSSETDDSGITFAPKKILDRSCSGGEARTIKPRVVKPSCIEDSSEKSIPSDHSPVYGEQNTGKIPGSLEVDYPHETHPSTPQPPDMSRSAAARQAGTQITETELMRRRRLLDSHIFGR